MAEHTQIEQTLLEQLSSPKGLAFQDFLAARSGDRPFQLVTDAYVDGLGAVVEQDQSASTTRPICFRSRAALLGKISWSATDLECAGIVCAVKNIRQLFYDTSLVTVSGHHPQNKFRAFQLMLTEYNGGMAF